MLLDPSRIRDLNQWSWLNRCARRRAAIGLLTVGWGSTAASYPPAVARDMDLTYVLNGRVLTGDITGQIPEYLHEAVVAVEDLLSEKDHANDGALIFVPGGNDELPRDVKFEVHTGSNGFAAYIPGRGRMGEPTYKIIRRGTTIELRLTCSGYEKFRRRDVVRPRHIVI